jgi:delta8-fatty-acid desaturase
VLIIYNSQLINATKWAPSHPGGALALLHFVGRDATDEIDAYHSEPAKKRMERMVMGRVEFEEQEGWKPLTPPIALGLVQHKDGQAGHWMSGG